MIKFVADAMLGKLTKWLRLLGYDVLYSAEYSDSQIIDIAKRQNRVILTSDRGLYYRAKKIGVGVALLALSKPVEMLATLYSKGLIELEVDPNRSRCPHCNGKLIRVEDKSMVKSRVPPGALKTYKVFYICASCNQVYWEGSHWKNIRRITDEAKLISARIKSA
ncbi:MAG: Mut7-C RNAse domain-containing protein [Caldisphaeraceae archaeon]|nr:Mut7-C RNAse domain-containing protein [Caldisphaeraceae archaeon]